jgi:hypothetical protein
MLSTGHGRKSDAADALSVGIAALTATGLNNAATNDVAAVLRALREHRDDLVRTRTETANRLHILLAQLVPAGHPRGLTADDAAVVLRSVRPRTPLGRTLRRLAVELVGELRRLDRRIAAAATEIGEAVEVSGSTLTSIYGVGTVVAAKLLARTGSIRRFRSCDAIATTWDRALVQTCIIHLIRNTFRYASKAHWEKLAKDLRPVYTAPNEQAASARFDEFTDAWGGKYPAIIALWRNAWPEFIPFLDYEVEIRRIICSTNAIESLNARYRRATRACGHFPTEQAALKCLYMVTRSLDPTVRGRARWAVRWKPALNAFAITFAGRITHSTTT